MIILCEFATPYSVRLARDGVTPLLSNQLEVRQRCDQNTPRAEIIHVPQFSDHFSLSLTLSFPLLHLYLIFLTAHKMISCPSIQEDKLAKKWARKNSFILLLFFLFSYFFVFFRIFSFFLSVFMPAYLFFLSFSIFLFSPYLKSSIAVPDVISRLMD